MLGLRWALHQAGARGLIVALWGVPDAETAKLMERFYAHWRPGRDPARAFTRAQRDVLAAQRRAGDVRPSAWAGFIASGIR